MFDPPLRNFEYVNYIAAASHLVQAIVTAVYDKDAIIPVQESYIDWEESDACTNASTAQLNEFVLTPRDEVTHELSLKWLIASFHFLSFFFETLVTIYPRVRVSYLDSVKVGANGWRFIEYSASASVMLIAIALVSGIWDSYALIGIGFLTSITMVLGGVAEQLFSDEIPKQEQRGRRSLTTLTQKEFPLTLRARYLGWVCHFAGWLSMLSAYGIILRNFYFANAQAEVHETAQAPWFVYVIVVAIFLLYNGFGAIQLVQLWAKTSPGFYVQVKQLFTPDNVKLDRGKVVNTVLNERIEMAYVVNSLVSKSLLGWLIFANVIMGDRAVCE